MHASTQPIGGALLGDRHDLDVLRGQHRLRLSERTISQYVADAARRGLGVGVELACLDEDGLRYLGHRLDGPSLVLETDCGGVRQQIPIHWDDQLVLQRGSKLMFWSHRRPGLMEMRHAPRVVVTPLRTGASIW